MQTEMESFLDFCLACDRQTDGQVYCSESCRLAEYEKSSSNPSSTASSPHSPGGISAWPSIYSTASHGTRTPLHLEPAFDFLGSNYSRPVVPASALSHPSTRRPKLTTRTATKALTPSTSHASLRSFQSVQTAQLTSTPELSDEARRALTSYASSFDQSRYSRRQSTT